jgi:hypothetical protein
VHAFEEVVAEQRVLRHTAAQGAVERGGFVDALADVDAVAEEVLVDVRDAARVKVEAGVARENPRQRRGARAARLHLDARLEHGVSGRDASAPLVELGMVQWVRQRRRQPSSGVARDLGVGVERDHEAHVRERDGIADVHGKAGAAVAGEQAIELRELAALALPPHPAAFRRVPAPAAVKEMEGAAATLPVLEVERGDAGARAREEIAVLGHGLGGCVGEVRQEGEHDVRVRAREPVDLDAGEECRDLACIREQHRHRDDGAAVGGHSAAEIHARQHARREDARHDGIDDAHRDRQQRGDGEHERGDRHCGARPRRDERRDERELVDERHECDRSEVGLRRMST